MKFCALKRGFPAPKDVLGVMNPCAPHNELALGSGKAKGPLFAANLGAE